jgi:hypothetical protein
VEKSPNALVVVLRYALPRSQFDHFPHGPANSVLHCITTVENCLFPLPSQDKSSLTTSEPTNKVDNMSAGIGTGSDMPATAAETMNSTVMSVPSATVSGATKKVLAVSRTKNNASVLSGDLF